MSKEQSKVKKRKLLETLLAERVIEKHDEGWYRTITLSAICDAANQLLQLRATISSIDVKCWLMNKGYWGGQGSFRNEMDGLVLANILNYRDDDKGRHYFPN